MQHTSSLALLSALYSVTVAAAGSLPRGVSPEFATHYHNKNVFTCITNKNFRIPANQVNDNTCDCPDGSDEPGTAACAFIDPLSPKQPLKGSPSGSTNTTPALPGFWCANKGHIGAYVPFTYVNDGVCDYDLCCDGTEEFGGRVKCENRCASIGKEYRKLESEKKSKLERAGKKRDAMLEEAKALRVQLEANIGSLKREVGELEQKKNDLQQKHKEAERDDRTRVVKSEGAATGKLGVLVGVAKARVTELRNTLDNVVRQRDDLNKKVDELEGILRKFKDEYNPNFNDEGVKSAVKSFEDYAARVEAEALEYLPNTEVLDILKEDSETSGVNWPEFESGEEGADTDILYNFQAYLPGFVNGIINDKLEALREWLVSNGMLADSGTKKSESSITKAARKAAEAAEKELKNKNKELTKEEEDLRKDYGPADIFRSLKGKCVDTDQGEYTYELCWMAKTSQKSKKGHGNTGMGNFERIEWADADEEDRLDGRSLGQGRRMVLKYENGQSCWNGPKRRTDVWLGCAETEELWRVSESEKCVYKMEVGTPAACEPDAASAADKKKKGGKDEL